MGILDGYEELEDDNEPEQKTIERTASAPLILDGDCLQLLPGLDANSVDAVVTDPPYGLAFMGKDWDKFGLGKYQHWTEQWARECLRVLKPGGHLLAFGGTRTSHRLAAGIEDAGFELRDTVQWLYGSGFPKSRDVSKSIDKEAGAKREVIGQRNTAKGDGGQGNDFLTSNSREKSIDITAPATPEAEQWQGWGTAIKPAHEPIIVARKPFKGTVAANVLEWGTGAFNIDGCRIRTNEVIASHHSTNNPRIAMGGAWHEEYQAGDAGKFTQTKGRWPANVVLTHLDECEPAGERKVRSGNSNVTASKPTDLYGEWSGKVGTHYADTDGTETIEAWNCAEGCPVAELDRQSGELHHQDPRTRRSRKVTGGQTFDLPGMSACYADSGGASRFFYTAKASRKERGAFNDHPTVKPLALMRWLVRLVTPPGGLVLDPFAGSGTTLLAAREEGFDAIGIELDEHYCEIAAQRLGGDVGDS